jgi:hypothetical protein
MYPTDPGQGRSMQPPPSASASRTLQIDSSMAFHPQGYYQYPPGSASSLGLNHSSPSGSESVGTPPDGFHLGKRTASQITNGEANGSRKKVKRDDSEVSADKDGSEAKVKSTRGSRYVFGRCIEG